MKLKQVAAVMAYNFWQWHKNSRFIATVCLAFLLCFMLSDKTVKLLKEYNTTMQIMEAFVWTFGDSNSILLSSLLLVLLFADIVHSVFRGHGERLRSSRSKAGMLLFLQRISSNGYLEDTGSAVGVCLEAICTGAGNIVGAIFLQSKMQIVPVRTCDSERYVRQRGFIERIYLFHQHRKRFVFNCYRRRRCAGIVTSDDGGRRSGLQSIRLCETQRQRTVRYGKSNW